MRRILVNMKDLFFADALAQSLQADPRGGFTVQRVTAPEELVQYSALYSPYAVLMEVTRYPPYGMEERLKIRNAVKNVHPDCKVVLVVDENSETEAADRVRQAKKEGVDVTCETAPHYLLLTEKDLKEEGRFKMNPPLREEEDRQALIEGVLDGTVDMIATDHAPHSREEKSRGLGESPFGIVGLETAFPVLYTGLVKEGILTLEKLVELLSGNPRRRFGLPLEQEEYTVFEIKTPYEICGKDFLSKGKSSPFEGWTVYGKCKKTVCGGRTVWQETVQEN